MKRISTLISNMLKCSFFQEKSMKRSTFLQNVTLFKIKFKTFVCSFVMYNHTAVL